MLKKRQWEQSSCYSFYQFEEAERHFKRNDEKAPPNVNKVSFSKIQNAISVTECHLQHNSIIDLKHSHFLPEPEFQFESYKMLDYYNLRGVVIFKGTEEARARMVANDAIRLKKDSRKKDYLKSPLDCWERTKKLFELPEMEFKAYEAKDKQDGFKLFKQKIFKKGER